MRKLRITVDGKAFEVQVELLDEPAATSAPLPLSRPVTSAPAVAAPQAPSSANPAAGPGDVPSPLAGRVVSVDCNIGDQVNAGDKVLTIEAMKMNTYINAHSSGKVTAIHVAPGDGVEEGQAVVTIS